MRTTMPARGLPGVTRLARQLDQHLIARGRVRGVLLVDDDFRSELAGNRVRPNETGARASLAKDARDGSVRLSPGESYDSCPFRPGRD